jgi:hypothetical protein
MATGMDVIKASAVVIANGSVTVMNGATVLTTERW